MAFAVICKSCQARFLLNDDLLRRKVAGRVVTVRCRQCHAPIEVDASDVSAKALAEPETPEPRPMPPAKTNTGFTTKTAKPAPAPPRPAGKTSTLMGIGGPPRPAGATELVALSPGLLELAAPAAPAATSAADFPEPPPPPPAPGARTSDEWEIPSTIPPKPDVKAKAEPVATAKAPAPPKPVAPTGPNAARPRAITLPLATSTNDDAAPESLDDFAEELPPSLPAPTAVVEEEAPSSTGTPSLEALVHHERPIAKPSSHEFLANISASPAGMLPSSEEPPTIDVSSFALEVSAPPSPASPPVPIEVPFEVASPPRDQPRTGKQTLPLFEMSGDAHPGRLAAPSLEAALQPPAPRPTPQAPKPAGSLSPATGERSPRSEGVRERRNVVAPATNSVPPLASEQRTSRLAVPLLLALAGAAGFMIWKRSAAPQTRAAAESSASASVATAPRFATANAAATEAPATPTIASAAPAPVAPEDDVTFETTPAKPAAALTPREPAPTAAARPAVADDRPGEPKTSEPKPTEPKPTEAKPEPAAPAPTAKTPSSEPAPSPPSGEPVGPFNREAAAAALTAAAGQASSCRKDGDPSGVASVVITFAPSGRVTSATIGGPPFAGTPTGGCIASTLRKARVPPFEGDRVTVSKTIVVQ